MKNKKYHTVGKVTKSDRNVVERGKTDTINTQIHDRSLSCFGTGTLIKSGVVNFAESADKHRYPNTTQNYKKF